MPYDRFRDRVMFPITDFRGRIIAFGGRALSADAPAKYLNSPETPLFHKGSNLYNGAAARQAVHDGAPLIVVEGYVDVIAMVTAGYPATVAPLGTALTEDQLGLLWKMADEPILCFDGDKAGQRAAYPRGRHGAAAVEARQEPAIRACCPTARTRTTSFARAGARRSPRCWRGARPLGDMLWTRETEAASFDTPERRAAFEARVHEVVRSIGDESVRKYYAQDFSARLRQLMTPTADAAGAASARAARRARSAASSAGNARSGNVRDFSRGRDSFRRPRPAERRASRRRSRARGCRRARSCAGSAPRCRRARR